ncbi:MAG: hypothetical protein WD176_04365, partial [Pirellulales bacterium]
PRKYALLRRKGDEPNTNLPCGRTTRHPDASARLPGVVPLSARAVKSTGGAILAASPWRLSIFFGRLLLHRRRRP